MSYDINFWKPRAGTSPDPQATYERLNRRELPDELAPLPVEQVLAKLKEAFHAFNPAEKSPVVELPHGSVEFSWSDKHVRLDFRGFDTGAEKARAWQVLSAFGCVCYDPQSGTLHTRSNPPEYRALTTDEMRQLDTMLGGREFPTLIRRPEDAPARPAAARPLPRVLVAAIILAAILAALVYVFR
jgi:hypothetical protein